MLILVFAERPVSVLPRRRVELCHSQQENFRIDN